MKPLALCILVVVILLPIRLSDLPYNIKFASRQAEVKSIIREFTNIVPDNVAYRIAQCESQNGLYTENWEGGSATGLFMFQPRTWDAYCQGDINSFIDQTICFDNLYPKHPSWWECK